MIQLSEFKHFFSMHNGSFFLAVAFLPFTMFYWMLPFVSDWTIGNDYQIYGIQAQMELLFSMKTGTFPLYVPGFAGGQSASALTLGQIFHPMTWAAAILPGYWNGKALELMTLLRLFSLAVAHFGLFLFLRKIKLTPFWAFMISAITVYNLRMLDLFRYSASLESWTGLLFLVAAIGCYCVDRSKWHLPLCIAGSTYWIITSGHPQMMYYGLMEAGVLALAMPFYINAKIPEQKMAMQDVVQFWLWTGGSILAGLLLSAAYHFPFYIDFILTNAGRVGRGYAWMDGFRDTFIGTLNNFCRPLKSDVHSAFGGSPLFLMAALIPLIRLFRVKIPPVIWGIWGFSVVVFLHMQGARTPVHFLFWKYVPLASTFRVAGRISLMLPVLYMLILGWAIGLQEKNIHIYGRKISAKPQQLLAVGALLFFCGLWACPLFHSVKVSSWSPENLRDIPKWVEGVIVSGGILSLVCFILCWYPDSWEKAGKLILFVTIFCHLTVLLQYGTWVEKKKDTPSFTQMMQEKTMRLGYRPTNPGIGMASKTVLRQVEHSFLEPFLGKLYGRCKIVDDVDQAFEEMAKSRHPDEVVLVQKPGWVQKEKRCIENPSSELKGRVELTYSAFNRLVFDVTASQDGWLGLAWPYSGNWHARINDKKVELYQANGHAHAVFIPEGHSRVEFRYSSIAATSGMAVSCFTFAVIGCGVIYKQNRFRKKAVLAGIILILCTTIFLFWQHRLYTGKSLNTRYTWQAMSHRPLENMAYGKRTSASSLPIKYFPFLHSSGEAVDGKRTPDSFSGFFTKMGNSPWWSVDLARPKQIGAIILYERGVGLRQNARPLHIRLSKDGKAWKTFPISSLPTPSPTTITFAPPEVARHIVISPTGRCRLIFDEIEIYPPADQN